MDNNNQAAFMGALNSLKEYAKVNGNIVTKQDVESYFKDLGLDDSKYQMITGYLLANDITVKGENGVDNEFLNMLEKSAVKRKLQKRRYLSQMKIMKKMKNIYRCIWKI